MALCHPDRVHLVAMPQDFLTRGEGVLHVLPGPVGYKSRL